MNTLRTFREGISNGLRIHGEYVYVGTMNRSLRLLVVCVTLLTVCDNAANGLPNVSQRIANALRIRICGHDESAPTAADGLR